MLVQLLIAAFLLGFVAAGDDCQAQEVGGLNQNSWNTLTSWAADAVERNFMAGAQLMVTRGDLVYEFTTGYKNIEDKEPMPSNALFRMFSSSKLVANVATLVLVDQGKLLLSDPIELYLPEFANPTVCSNEDCSETEPAETSISVEHLLTQTSGLRHCMEPRELGICEQFNLTGLGGRDKTLEEEVKLHASAPLLYHPGKESVYSISPDVLGRIVEVVMKKKLSEALQDLVFGPAGMTETFFHLYPETNERDADLQKRMATAYCPVVGEGKSPLEARDGFGPIPPPFDAMLTLPVDGPRMFEGLAAGLVSSAADYTKFFQAVNRNVLFSPHILQDSLRVRHTMLKLFPLTETKFTLLYQSSLTIDDSPSFGWGGAFHTVTYAVPDQDFTFVFMAQMPAFCDIAAFMRSFQVLGNLGLALLE